MSRNDKTGAEAARTRRKKASASRSTSRPARKSATASVKGANLTRLTRERDEALEQQAATADILKVISQSAFDLNAVLEALVSSAARLCQADTGVIRRREGDIYPVAATFGLTEEQRGHFERYTEIPDRGSVFGRAILERRSIHVPDLLTDRELNRDRLQDYAKVVNIRSGLGVPLIREGNIVGVFTLQRRKRRPYTRKQIELVETFANQAVIAIENTRLFDEVQAKTRDLTQSLQQQTATAEVLKVIASSPSDVQPVFEAIVNNAARLIGGFSAAVLRFIDGAVHLAAITAMGPAEDETVRTSFPRPIGDVHAVLQTGKVLVIPDTEDYSDALLKSMARVRGYRSVLYVPLKSSGTSIGAIAVTRKTAGSFAAHHIDLLQTFADQAVIAIENVRLFNETKEALEQQTATSEVLEVISSSPGELQPVFQKMLENATRVCEANFGILNLWDGEKFNIVADHHIPPEFATYRQHTPLPPQTGTLAEVVRTHRATQIPDLRETPGYQSGIPHVVRMADVAGARTLMTVPMLKEHELLGAFTIFRQEVRPFTDKQIALVENFSKQAIIAIENTRLFNELQARTRELSEALTYQTGSANILNVIASSPTEVEPALHAIVESACKLCDAYDANVLLKVGNDLHFSAHHGPIPTGTSARPISREWATGRSVVDKVPVQVADYETPEVAAEFPEGQRQSREQGHRCTLAVPLLRESEAIGAIVLRRLEPIAFNQKQINLLQSFADQAVIAIENTRLFTETREALERQTATADILKVIASSPNDVQPVFEAIAESARRLCGGHTSIVTQVSGGFLHLGASSSADSETGVEELHAVFPLPLSMDRVHGRAALSGEIAFCYDTESEPDVTPIMKETARARGYRSLLVVPMMREGFAIGTIGVSRREAGRFPDKFIELLLTFADQAVIAIGNVRLFDEVQTRTTEVTEALEQQAATSEVLGVISRSLGQVEPVFQSMLANAMRICEAQCGAMFSYANGAFWAVSCLGVTPDFETFLREKREWGRETGMGRAALTKQPVHVVDTVADRAYTNHDPARLASVQLGGVRTFVIVPMLKDGELIGAMSLYRRDVRAYTDKQIKLVSTFADQAVIAIENARLFNETREALERQTATADILKVIASSPSDVQPVFEAIAERSNRLMDGLTTAVYSIVDDTAHLMAFTRTSPEADAELQANFPRPLSQVPWTIPTRNGDITEIPDAEAEWAEQPDILKVVRMRGFRSALMVPLVRDGACVGVISVTRKELGRFEPHHIQLLQTFADQAVIAISNVELFQQVQAKTRDLTESLAQQTATSEVLQVISSTPGDLEPVFMSMLENATRICGANFGQMNLYQDGSFRPVANYNVPAAYAAYLVTRTPFQPHRQSGLGTVAQTHKVLHVADIRTLPAYLEGDPSVVAIADLAGARSYFVVPMLKEDELVGAITIYRQEVKPFAEKQTDVVANFANQAVIAIENTRLLRELRERTDDLSESLQQQTATAEVLQIISSSPGDLAPVFEKMLVNAMRVCSAKFGSMLLAENGSMRPAAQYNVPAEFAVARGDRVLTPHPKSALAKAISTKQVVHVADMRTTEAYLARSPASIELVELGGARTVAIVPMLRDNEVIGAITVYRNEVQLFSDKQIELLSNFAKQVVIAIENARLLKELRQRTDDLSQSLDDLRTAQDRLVQTEKLASLGQLTAGIAHEIKNPLNFVNNFSALSAELTDELNDVLKPVVLDSKVRGEVDELTGLLKDNLEKVVQHGKRADSIVKNMLLHSREGSGERRRADVNALVDESLNLAYHGARAEKSGFNITLERRFDAGAGAAELFPQEITRALLNLISNGFYAATRRKTENGEAGFEPTLLATTRDLGGNVEIRVRDNGTGIPPEVKEKMFNPFFTTKPAGEGTGLGLSMTHDIIVKQHGGQIEVHTEPGSFTEFTIILPRTGPRQP